MQNKTPSFRRWEVIALAAVVVALASDNLHAAGPTANGTRMVPAVTNDCGAADNCYRLVIRCTMDPNDVAIPLRFRPPAPGRQEFADVVIRESGVNPSAQPAGGVVFFTGSFGTGLYGNGAATDTSPADQTVTVIGQQYTAFEVRWLDAPLSEYGTNVFIPATAFIGAQSVNQTLNPGHGYESGAEGYGSVVDKCGVKEIFEWISSNRTPHGDQKLCGTGNSGGGMQIAYALTIYGAANYLKSAVMTGGPSYSKIFNGCFDPIYNNGLGASGSPDGTTPSMTLGLSPATHPGRQLLEAALGWPAGSCSIGHPYASDPARRTMANFTSLVVDALGVNLRLRDYAPSDDSGVLTKQYFVRASMDNTGAQIQGNAYINQLLLAGNLLTNALDDVVQSDGGSPPAFLQHEVQDTAAGAAKIRAFLTSNNNCTYASTPVAFGLADRGGVSLQTNGKPGAPVAVGYAKIQPTAGSTTPSGLAIFAFRQNGILVSEAGVPASPLIQSGRIYAEINGNGAVNTGLAIANPGTQPAAVSFYFTNQTGNFGNGTTTIPPGGQLARFLDQSPYNGGSSVSGTLTFTSSAPISVVALRGLSTDRGEFLITTLPVVDLGVAASAGIVVFPHFADGGGWITQIVLVNPTENTLSGSIQLRNPNGQPASVSIGGQTGSSFAYAIPPRTSQKLQMSGTSTSVLSGSVRVVPAANGVAPSGVAIFSFRNGATTVAEAGVPAVAPGTAFRSYAQTLTVPPMTTPFGDVPQSIGSIQTGLAVTNMTDSAATVIVELTTLSGESTVPVGTLTLPPNGQTSIFLNQISEFGSLPNPFQGVMRLSSSASISVVALRGRYNERNDFLITTIPTVNETTPASSSPHYFPHIADSGGYTTQFILYSGRAGQSSSGALSFFKETGSDWTLSLR